eukprot:13011123-Ditylum_brightwellii.AAC.1
MAQDQCQVSEKTSTPQTLNIDATIKYNEPKRDADQKPVNKHNTDGRISTTRYSPEELTNNCRVIDLKNSSTITSSTIKAKVVETVDCERDDAAEFKRIKTELMQSRQRIKNRLESLRMTKTTLGSVTVATRDESRAHNTYMQREQEQERDRNK